MALRMVFRREDTERVRLAAAPDPLWELVLSLHCAQAETVSPPYAAWRRQVRTRCGDTGGSWLRRFALLRDLVPPRGDFPDFLTPAATDLDAGCEALACTPAAEVRADLAATFATRPAPAWVRALADGDRAEVHRLTAAVRHCFALLVEPCWACVEDTVAADRASRVHTMTGEGVGGLLAGLPGVIGWDGDTLVVRYPRNRTVFLGGRGLTLVPSYFCSGAPVTWIDPERPPVLVYPAEHRETSPAELPASLVPLLSRTRAECLHLLRAPHTTSQLGRALGVSTGSASKQAAVLRQAGLISSTRAGGAVVHRVTALGTGLLTGAATVFPGKQRHVRSTSGTPC